MQEGLSQVAVTSRWGGGRGGGRGAGQADRGGRAAEGEVGGCAAAQVGEGAGGGDAGAGRGRGVHQEVGRGRVGRGRGGGQAGGGRGVRARNWAFTINNYRDFPK